MTRQHPVQSIVIVGGGTAGWLSAAILSRALNTGAPRVRLMLVESRAIPTVGVGEATIPTLLETLRFLGIPERDFMAACDATFKLAIRFEDWHGADTHDTGSDTFWHPFGRWPGAYGAALPLHHHWLHGSLHGSLHRSLHRSLHGQTRESLARACFPAVRVCEAKRAPKRPADPDYSGAVEYAYHVDAGRLAAYLREYALAAGARHVVDTVTGVTLAASGLIEAVQTAAHGPLDGDLFIDCTGFRGLLINEALGEPFESFDDSLLCDAAIAIGVPRAEASTTPLNPYTTSTALAHGWQWHTPLAGRDGYGYVYSSAFCDADAAESELRARLRAAHGPAAGDAPARRLRMRVGMTRRAWVGNCVAVGLSGGFVEPLESTGIHCITAGLEALLHHFPAGRFVSGAEETAAQAAYNRHLRALYEEVRDFIVLHYCLTRREDTAFWRAAQHERTIPDTLAAQLAAWRQQWPVHRRKPGLIFPAYSTACILAGQGVLPQTSAPLLAYGDEAASAQLFAGLAARGVHLAQTLPDHAAWVREVPDASRRVTVRQTPPDRFALSKEDRRWLAEHDSPA